MNAPIAPSILRDAIARELAKRRAESSLYEFVQQAWHVVEPGVTFVHGFHLATICEHLQAVSDGDIKRLLINIPPRHAKSTIVSVMWPMWEWLSHPSEKFLCASYSGVLSIRDNLKARRLVTSPWYQGRWGNMFRLAGDQNQKTRYENDMTGYRIATSVGGTATGEGGSRLLLDDPHGAQDAQSDTMRGSTLEWYDMVWSTRLNDPKRDAMVTVMQRLHEDDVSGHALAQGGWEHLCLPAEYDGAKRTTVMGSYDPRETIGSLLWPERFDSAVLDNLKRSLGEYGTAGQLQQRPSPVGGGILKTKHFQKWRGDLPVIEYILQSYDGAYTEKTSGDPTACSTWGVFQHKNRPNVILLDAWAEHLGYPALRRKVLDDWKALYGAVEGDPAAGIKPRKGRRPDMILVEDKSSGISLIQDLRAANIPATPYNPGRADKIARAHNIAPVLEMDIIWIPESAKRPGEFISWALPLVDQVGKFPNAANDDLTDTVTQGLLWLRDGGFLDLDYFEGDEPEDIDYYAKKKARTNPYAV